MSVKGRASKVLLVEDDLLFRQAMSDSLSDAYQVQEAETVAAGQALLAKELFDVVLIDITLPGTDGTELLKFISIGFPQTPVIMLTAIDRISKVVECIKLGAFDYLTKPVIAEELFSSIQRAIESGEIKRELEQRRKLQLIHNKEFKLIGESVSLNKLRKQIEAVAKTDSPVLIQGETGTGKEVTAREIHNLSPRDSRPFVAINCGAMPKELIESEFFGYKKGAFTGAASNEIGKFELANSGTLLLDEIGELSLEAQTKILRVLEEHEFYPVGSTQLTKVDVRIIASTNRNLMELVKQNRFREDLYFRLNVYAILIPPLRERPEDILTLTRYFIHHYNLRFGKNFKDINAEAAEVLMQHYWKGNVRELRNIVERVLLSEQDEVLRKEHLFFIDSTTPFEALDAFRLSPAGINLEELEKKLLMQALELAGGNKAAAARLLRLSRPTFEYRLSELGLH
jgi:DNA-binding NtrC family response regulator